MQDQDQNVFNENEGPTPRRRCMASQQDRDLMPGSSEPILWSWSRFCSDLVDLFVILPNLSQKKKNRKFFERTEFYFDLFFFYFRRTFIFLFRTRFVLCIVRFRLYRFVVAYYTQIIILHNIILYYDGNNNY